MSLKHLRCSLTAEERAEGAVSCIGTSRQRCLIEILLQGYGSGMSGLRHFKCPGDGTGVRKCKTCKEGRLPNTEFPTNVKPTTSG